MKATQFFLGFGPRLWSFRRGETEYGVRALPLGAFVRIIGMNNLDEVPPADEARTYRQQSFPRRMLVISAGSLMHLLIAIVLLFTVYADPRASSSRRPAPRCGTVQTGGPAAAAGIQDRRRHPQHRRHRRSTTPDELGDGRARPRARRRRRPSCSSATASSRRSPSASAPTPTEADPHFGAALLGVSSRGADRVAVDVARRGRRVERDRHVPAGVGDRPRASSRCSTRSTSSTTSPASNDDLGDPADDGRRRHPGQRHDRRRPRASSGCSSSSPRSTCSSACSTCSRCCRSTAATPPSPTYERARERNGQRYFADVSKLMPFAMGVIVVLLLLFMSGPVPRHHPDRCGERRP